MATRKTPIGVRPEKRDGIRATKASLLSVEVGPTPGEKSAPPSTAAATQGGEQRVIASSSEVVKQSRNCNALCTGTALFCLRLLYLGEDFFHAA